MYSRTDATRFLDRLAVMLRTLCAHPKPIVGFRSGAKELADRTLVYLSSRPDRTVLGSPPCAIYRRYVVRTHATAAQEAHGRARLLALRAPAVRTPTEEP